MIYQNSLVSGMNVILSDFMTHAFHMEFLMTVYSVYFFRDPIDFGEAELDTEAKRLFLGLWAWHFLISGLKMVNETKPLEAQRAEPMILQTYFVLM